MGKGRYNWLVTHDPKWIRYQEIAKKARQDEKETKEILNLYGIKNIHTRARGFASHGNPCYGIGKGAQIKTDEAIFFNGCYIITDVIYHNMPDIIKEATKAMQWLVNEMNYAYMHAQPMSSNAQYAFKFVNKYYELYGKLEKEYEIQRKNSYNGKEDNTMIERYKKRMSRCIQFINEWYKYDTTGSF